MDIYNNKDNLKLLILAAAILIGGASIYYTDLLVKKLAEREKKLIDLYAKGLKNISDPQYTGDLQFIANEILTVNTSIPVILTDEKGIPKSWLNIDMPENISEEKAEEILLEEIEEMKAIHDPIIIDLSKYGIKDYIYYKNSYLLSQLQFYPYIQLTIISIFAVLAYLAFSYSRRSEQNRVWVGLAKETAHQLGTPLSSLMAWLEILKTDPQFQNNEFLAELEKDIERFSVITARFSNIGTVGNLKEVSPLQVIKETVNYLQNRIPSKVSIAVGDFPEETKVMLNEALFAWVIENLCKNAVDAIGDQGKISIDGQLIKGNHLAIDITDTGKGISSSKVKQIFKPGFTTKQRGWGLGLTLVKRIVENYHTGKISVLRSELGKGTTFRIVLPVSRKDK